jgi:voltage-gated potassium channel
VFNSRQLRYFFIIPLAVVCIGTAGFMVFEKLSFLDSLYFTIATIATVGYGDIHPVTPAGKIFAIIVIVIGIGTFLAMVTGLTQVFLQRRQLILNRQRIHMLVGVFFTEAGNELLRIFTGFDPHIASIRKEFLVTADWKPERYLELKKRLISYEYKIDPAGLELEKIHSFLYAKGDLLIRQVENADLIENENFTGLLWATVHLRDELAARPSLKNLPKADIAHIANDAKRAYGLLTLQWIDYLQFLKIKYPFLFSLALRTNPFVENPDAVIKV